MPLDSATAEQIVDVTVAAVRRQEPESLRALEAHPCPLYATDVDGRIVWFNRACIDFSGRTPQAGSDRWCVTWKLYTPDGAPLPHDVCPVAIALRERRPIRGVEAIAERPDGARVRFLPLPTPVVDDDGTVLGAVNLILDLSERPREPNFQDQADRCRRLARSVDDRATTAILLEMADEFEEKARRQRPN